jgi:hypothetical protein
MSTTVEADGADPARGCPVCDWRGEVAQTHDRTHNYYTHIIVRGNEIFRGDTCSERTQPRDPGPATRLWRWLHA